MQKFSISNQDLDGALTLDQLIAELQAAKASGLATGQERVCFGSGFMDNCFPVRSVALMPNDDGDISLGVSAESEREWRMAMSSVGAEEFLNVIDPAKAPEEDPLALAQRLGFKKRVAQMESEQLRQEAPAPATRQVKKSL
jgi:hypothetical protein